MRKRRVLWAIVFGTMLAVTGCGDDGGGDSGGGDGGSSGSGGSSCGGDFCGTLCGACGMDVMAQCLSTCEELEQALGGTVDLDRCPNELNAWGSCLESNGCDSNLCADEEDAWIMCVAGVAF